MLRSIATVSVSGTLVEKLAAIRAAGFDGVEIFENDLLYFDGSPADIRKRCADLGLQITLFQPFRDFEGVSKERLTQNLNRAQRKFELMHELGTDLVLVCSNVNPNVIADDALIVDQLGQLALLAEREGVRVGFEALAWGKYVNSYRHAWRLVDAVDHPALGLILDSFHTLSIDDPIEPIADIPGDRIAFVQIADAPLQKMDVLEWSRHYRCFPGQGDLDVAGFADRVLATGYQGPFSLEIFNDGFRAAPTAATAADGYRSLLYLEEQAVLKGARSKDGQPLFTPPAPPAHSGFQFIEFAVDSSGAPRLAQRFAEAGFHAAGKHRSKDVTLYQQGGASIVLNAETDSFASEFFHRHGLSLCASAFQVDDAERVFERATSFGYAPFSGRVGPNERVVPGVRAPDGSLHYFVDARPDEPTLYEADFVLSEQGGERTQAVQGELKRIDHVCLDLPADTLDTWILYFKAVFGFDAEPAWLLPDPYGLVRSRAVRSADGSVRIVLNASVDGRTSTAQSLHTYRGSGLNHVAFDTDNIFSAVEQLRARDVQLLRIPSNYYDDLEARYDFADGVVTRMKEAHVLYDRDAQGGEFFHVYTEQMDGRFFLEVVQRKGGYDGYGAVNAPVRLAAQAQRKHG
ncbi:bifunctional sugar phosphate isomerase/epimerase/4-hydroxyphenylpyruvate dioxygenase family protein [Paraburkholderia largidicola]|uniref:3-dehydroshikimate dehydratase n=1 Tax=Paraburkholderia largidicola TaxID=3014751 RepID=A0A7I8BIY9_9BURK|nr:sugar phosphate isomerase/epimerase and 4-hydroxyphenylpyruvate domain-containing protein [Paraburkholderia sp. PGU16]BCF88445.1 4-hydroxyphenylpyruvate dioxygenase [Paraburkholderia sp. PGU16]